MDRTGGRTGRSPTPTRSGWRQRKRRRRQIGKKEATRPRWNGQRNWEEKKRMRCDYSILAESGWRERTPRKSWEGLKRAPHAPTSMIATRARVRERRGGGVWLGIEEGREIAAGRQEREGRQGTTTRAVMVIPPSPRGLTAKRIFPTGGLTVGTGGGVTELPLGGWSARRLPFVAFWLFHTCPFPKVWILPGGFFESEAFSLSLRCVS